MNGAVYEIGIMDTLPNPGYLNTIIHSQRSKPPKARSRPPSPPHKRQYQPPLLEEDVAVDAPPTATEHSYNPQVDNNVPGVVDPNSNAIFEGQGLDQDNDIDPIDDHPIQAPPEPFDVLCEMALNPEDPMNEDGQIDTPRRSHRNRNQTTWYDDEVEEEKQKLLRNGGQKATYQQQ